MTREDLKAKWPMLHLLEPGTKYIASRPIDDGWREVFPIYIKKHTDSPYPVITIDGLDYDAANEFLAEFNNGKSSFDGRVW